MLIKAIATVVPAYSMAIVKFPKKVFNDIDSIIAKFWWGQNGEKDKLHWQSWKKLSRRKNEGGMGFRVLEDFNLALLSKLCWRILKNSNAMWVRVLKGIYFHSCSFMEARKGSHPSWVWSSILAGRELLQENTAWRVGDGNDINVWHEKWVVGLEGIKLVCERIPDELKEMKVAELIDDETRK